MDFLLGLCTWRKTLVIIKKDSKKINLSALQYVCLFVCYMSKFKSATFFTLLHPPPEKTRFVIFVKVIHRDNNFFECQMSFRGQFYKKLRLEQTNKLILEHHKMLKEHFIPLRAKQVGWKTFSGDFSGPVKVAYFYLRTKKNSTDQILWTGYWILSMLLGLMR